MTTIRINNTDYTAADIEALINSMRRERQELIDYARSIEARAESLWRMCELLGALRATVDTSLPTLGGKL